MKEYLESTGIIDWQTEPVKEKAASLSNGIKEKNKIAEICFTFVRDEILHSSDHQRNPVTLRASEVLEHRTGYCYAKSHLLAALLRANGIPAGLCYQRLQLSDRPGTWCLHGLNAIYLEDYGWYRVDPRGNRSDVHAEFSPPIEKLAFDGSGTEEMTLPEIWPRPLPVVVATLSRYDDWADVWANLPDVLILDR